MARKRIVIPDIDDIETVDLGAIGSRLLLFGKQKTGEDQESKRYACMSNHILCFSHCK